MKEVKRGLAFEEYSRKGKKMLRRGYTTGTCAALASAAAAELLLTGKAPDQVRVRTGKGIEIVQTPVESGYAEASGGNTAFSLIEKDAGDDSDITDGMKIRADVSKLPEGGCGTGNVEEPRGQKGAGEDEEPGDTEDSGEDGKSGDPEDAGADRIVIDGGEGVGRVTKPGLDQPVGNAAINSVPRKMIRSAVLDVCERTGYRGRLQVIISVPGGREAAERTFNPMLGIEGGLSILGTSGIVEPMSEQALVDTIEVELRQGSLTSKRLILTPGNYGNDFIGENGLDRLGIPVLKCSNFLGETLDMMAVYGIEEVLFVSHVGKLVKVAGGIMNTHSKWADCRNEIFTAHTAIAGGSTELCRSVMHAATTDACIELLDGAGLREQVISSILESVQAKLEHRSGGDFRIGAVMFSNVYGLLGMTPEAETILKEWKGKKK